MNSIDKHAVAMIAIAGSSLDVIGALYLAYDLLGGAHGPLRTLTRAVTYSVLYGIGFGLALGPIYGTACGIAHGVSLGWELARIARGLPQARWVDLAMSAVRGTGYAIAGGFVFGPRFGIAFGILSTLGQTVAYRLGIRPGVGYRADTRPRLTRFQLLAAANRTLGYAITGYVSSLIAQHRDQALSIGLKTGFAIGFVTAIFGALTPLVEWLADHVPERRMGVFGIALLLIGFALQSVQYWLVVLDVTIR